MQPLQALPLLVSFLALTVAIKGYRRKTGVLVRGWFSTASSIDCDDPYVCEIVLENLKDRAITIFGIYLKIGSNYYVELEELDRTPLLLKPFETYHKRFGAIEFYSVSCKRIGLKELFKDEAIKKQLVLSTSEGRYKVASRISRWNPITTFFHNYLTAVVKPVRTTYKGKDIGKNVKYVLELTASDGREELLLLQRDSYQLKFNNFNLTEDALNSKDSLESCVRAQIEAGTLSAVGYKVHDMQLWRASAHALYEGNAIHARKLTPFRYHILGRLATIRNNRQLDLENKARIRGRPTPR